MGLEMEVTHVTSLYEFPSCLLALDSCHRYTGVHLIIACNVKKLVTLSI